MCITNKHQLFFYLLKAYTVIASSTTQGFEEDEINVPLTLSVFRDKEPHRVTSAFFTSSNLTQVRLS